MKKNENILIGIILVCIVAPIILIGAYNLVLYYLVSKDEINVEVFSQDLIEKFKSVEGITSSDTFKPTHFSFENPYGQEYYSYYQFEYEISKDEYEENNLSYGTDSDFDTLSYGLFREEKDEDTYLCRAKITKTFNKEKYDAFEKIYNEIHNIKPEEPVNYDKDKENNIANNSYNTSIDDVNSPGISDDFWKEYDNAVNNLDKKYFVTDFSNYKSTAAAKTLSNDDIEKIAEVGFKESAARIAGEGAENVKSQTIKLEEIVPNNYFTRKYRESDDAYPNLKMTAYVVTRENEMGNGIKIYIDPTTGLIVGGAAFGD